MMGKKEIGKIARKFQRETQRIVDESRNITSISIEIDGKKITVAEKNKSEPKESAGTDANAEST